MVSAVRSEVRALDRGVPVSQIKTLPRMIDERLSPKRLLTWVVVVFAAAALLLAAVGLYAVISYVVAQRTHEIGIRMALGADRRDVLWLALRDALWLVMLGAALGIPAALATSRLLASQFFGISAADPVAFGLAVLALLVVAAVAGYLPARRATRVDPLVALRGE